MTNQPEEEFQMQQMIFVFDFGILPPVTSPTASKEKRKISPTKNGITIIHKEGGADFSPQEKVIVLEDLGSQGGG